jgi:hypothetical protein
MSKKYIIDELNKLLKSKEISPSDKRKIRAIIKKASESKKINWKEIVTKLAELAGIGYIVYEVMKQ